MTALAGRHAARDEFLAAYPTLDPIWDLTLPRDVTPEQIMPWLHEQ